MRVAARAGRRRRRHRPLPLLIAITALTAGADADARAVTFEATIGGSVDDFDVSAYRARLAAKLGVSPEDIQLDVSAGSVVVTATITTSSPEQADVLSGEVH